MNILHIIIIFKNCNSSFEYYKYQKTLLNDTYQSKNELSASQVGQRNINSGGKKGKISLK